MLETLLITFREGLEAFLIVAITLAYLTKTGRAHLKKPVYFGIIAALVISATTGWHIAAMANTPLMEGILALVAGVLVASLTYYMMTSAHKIKDHIGDALEKHAVKTGKAAAIGVFIFTVVMIAREGMETALMLGAISNKTDASQMIMGAILGLGLTAFIAYLWASQSHKINLKLFMQVTGVFLFLFAVHLFLYGIYELTEVEGIFMYNPELHEAMRPYVSSQTLFGQLTIYGLLIVPCAWLGFASLKDMFTKKNDLAAAE